MIQQIVQETEPGRKGSSKKESETPAAKQKRLEEAAAFNAAKFAKIHTTMTVKVPEERLVPAPKQATASSPDEKDHLYIVQYCTCFFWRNHNIYYI